MALLATQQQKEFNRDEVAIAIERAIRLEVAKLGVTLDVGMDGRALSVFIRSVSSDLSDKVVLVQRRQQH